MRSQLGDEPLDRNAAGLTEADEADVVGVRHQRPTHGEPRAAELAPQFRRRRDERLEQREAVGAAAAAREHERPFVFAGPGRPPGRSAEVTAVVKPFVELSVEPVGAGEIDGEGIAVHADRVVAPLQRVIHVCLLPQVADERRIVDHVPEAGHSVASEAFEHFQRRQELPVRPGRHEVRDEQVGRESLHRLLEDLGAQPDDVVDRKRQVARIPVAVAIDHHE